MVYTNPIELTDNREQTEDDIAAVFADNIESVPEDLYFRHGYELLPQEPEEMPENLGHDIAFREINEQEDNFFMSERPPTAESAISDSVPPYSNASFCSIPNQIARDVWFDSSPADIEMDSEKVEKVKEVMVNITLPSSSIPEWAANVPEDQWKEYLLNRLHIKQNKKQE